MSGYNKLMGLLSITTIINKLTYRPELEFLDKEYYGVKYKYNFSCNICQHKWIARLNDIFKGCGCPKCSIRKMDAHPNWRGGKSFERYPSEWTDELKESIRNRDNRKCQYLNCEYDDTKNKIKLHVHHIDGNKNNCQEYNLISLCNSHHASIEIHGSNLWQYYFYQITGDYE